jgi:uncharacterized protein
VSLSQPGEQSFRILSLDGGGVRGAFIAACLAELEKQLRSPVAKYFDLIAGTSTGGIIAIGLGLGLPASQIEAFYLEKSATIFSKRTPAKLSFTEKTLIRLLKRKFGDFDEDWLFQCKYEAIALKETLTGIFGKSTLGEAIHCRLTIPAVDLIGGQTIVFKTPHLPGLVRDRSYLAVDVALATAAAPAYFPHATIKNGSAYSDGGLWANNPVMVAYAEAMKISAIHREDTKGRAFDSDHISILSIGTGMPTYFLKPKDNDSGLRWWGPRIYNVLSVSQSQGEDFKARYILGNRYHRIDFRIPDKSWDLDSIEMLQEYTHIGRQKAAEHFSAVKANYFYAQASPLSSLQSRLPIHSQPADDIFMGLETVGGSISRRVRGVAFLSLPVFKNT